jgi:hypothetical protein
MIQSLLFINIIFENCTSTAKSRDSSYKLTDFVEQSAKYIRFTLGADGTMDKEAFNAWCQLKQIYHIPVCDRASRKQIFQNLPPCVLLNKPTDDDFYYVRCYAGVDMIGKGADENFCAYDETNPDVFVFHQEKSKSRDSARALYERSREKYKGIARDILELEEIKGKRVYYLGEIGADVYDLRLNFCIMNPVNDVVYAIDMIDEGLVLAKKEANEWTLIAGEANTLVTGHMKAAQKQFEISQKENRASDVTEEMQGKKLVKILSAMPFCELFNERFAKPFDDIHEDGMYYVWGEDFFVERINGRFYIRGWDKSKGFIPLPSEYMQACKNQFVAWRENILQKVFYIVQDRDAIDEDNIRRVCEGISPEIAASLPPSFVTCPSVNEGRCIWIFTKLKILRYGANYASPDNIHSLFRNRQE